MEFPAAHLHDGSFHRSFEEFPSCKRNAMLDTNGLFRTVGRVSKTRPPSRKEETKTSLAAKEGVKGLENWSYPPRGGDACYDSLVSQAKRQARVYETPSLVEQEALLNRALECYPHTTPRPCFDSLDFTVEGPYSLAIRAICDYEVKKDATPGYPFSTLASENGQLLENFYGLVRDAVLARLQCLLALDTTKDYKPLDLFSKGCVGLVSNFIKMEAHGEKKFTSLRWRMINGRDLTDQVIARLLYTNQNKTEISIWKGCPSGPGLGLSQDEDLIALRSKFEEMHARSPVADSDVSGFDFNIKEWNLMLDARIRIALAGSAPSTTFGRILTAHVYSVCRTLYLMPDGYVYEQQVPGIQLSGTLNTSSTNSRIRVTMAWLVGAQEAYAMGDDCIETYVENAEALYEKYGYKLKFYSRVEDDLSFCSQKFYLGSDILPHPEDGTKTLFNFMNKTENTPGLLSIYNQLASEFRNHPRLDEFMLAADAVMQQTNKFDDLLLDPLQDGQSYTTWSWPAYKYTAAYQDTHSV